MWSYVPPWWCVNSGHAYFEWRWLTRTHRWARSDIWGAIGDGSVWLKQYGARWNVQKGIDTLVTQYLALGHILRSTASCARIFRICYGERRITNVTFIKHLDGFRIEIHTPMISMRKCKCTLNDDTFHPYFHMTLTTRVRVFNIYIYGCLDVCCIYICILMSLFYYFADQTSDTISLITWYTRAWGEN